MAVKVTEALSTFLVFKYPTVTRLIQGKTWTTCEKRQVANFEQGTLEQWQMKGTNWHCLGTERRRVLTARF